MEPKLQEIIENHDIIYIDNSLNNVPQKNIINHMYSVKRYSGLDRDYLRTFISTLKTFEELLQHEKVIITKPIAQEVAGLKETLTKCKPRLERLTRGLDEATLKNRFYNDYYGRKKFYEIMDLSTKITQLSNEQSKKNPTDPLCKALYQGITLLTNEGNLKQTSSQQKKSTRSKKNNHNDESLFTSVAYKAITSDKSIALITRDYDFERMFNRGVSRLFSLEYLALNKSVREAYLLNIPSIYIQDQSLEWRRIPNERRYSSRCTYNHLNDEENARLRDNMRTIWREYYHQTEEVKHANF